MQWLRLYIQYENILWREEKDLGASNRTNVDMNISENWLDCGITLITDT